MGVKCYQFTTLRKIIKENLWIYITFLWAFICSSPYFCTSFISSCSFRTSSRWQHANFSVDDLKTSQTGANVLRSENDNSSVQKSCESKVIYYAMFSCSVACIFKEFYLIISEANIVLTVSHLNVYQQSVMDMVVLMLKGIQLELRKARSS